MKKDLEKALNYDSLHEAEKMTGKSYKEDESTGWLGMLLGIENSTKKNVKPLLKLKRIKNLKYMG